MRNVRPVAPRTASRAGLRWRWTPAGHSERWGNWGGRPYSWRAHALSLIDQGVADLEVQFLTRQGWSSWRRVTVEESEGAS